MGELFSMAGIITAIVLCFVGIVKLPFSKFKAKKPKLYKATFTILSLVSSVGACLIVYFYILPNRHLTDFAILLSGTIAGVFGLYSSYEGLGLKNLVTALLAKIQELAEKAPESKFNKYVDKIGIDKALEFITTKQKESVKEEIKEVVVEAPVETTTQTDTNF